MLSCFDGANQVDKRIPISLFTASTATTSPLGQTICHSSPAVRAGQSTFDDRSRHLRVVFDGEQDQALPQLAWPLYGLLRRLPYLFLFFHQGPFFCIICDESRVQSRYALEFWDKQDTKIRCIYIFPSNPKSSIQIIDILPTEASWQML